MRVLHSLTWWWWWRWFTALLTAVPNKKEQIRTANNKNSTKKIETNDANLVNPSNTHINISKFEAQNAVHCKHISISKAFQRAKPKYHPLFSSLECVCVWVSLPCGCSIAHKHVCDTLLLAIYKWIALKCFKRHACDIWCVCLRARTLFLPT